jgi:hypothetical protein
MYLDERLVAPLEESAIPVARKPVNSNGSEPKRRQNRRAS